MFECRFNNTEDVNNVRKLIFKSQMLLLSWVGRVGSGQYFGSHTVDLCILWTCLGGWRRMQRQDTVKCIIGNWF